MAQSMSDNVGLTMVFLAVNMALNVVGTAAALAVIIDSRSYCCRMQHLPHEMDADNCTVERDGLSHKTKAM